MTIPMNLKGGRGKKAPYNTVLVRVPEPLKELVVELSDDYRWTSRVPNFHKDAISYADALGIAESICDGRGYSAKLMVMELLQKIYRV